MTLNVDSIRERCYNQSTTSEGGKNITDVEKISRQQAAELLGVSLSSIDRAVRDGTLQFANWDAPRGARRYFTQADLDNYILKKPLQIIRTCDLLTRILCGDQLVDQSPLGHLALENLKRIPLDIVIQVTTNRPGAPLEDATRYYGRFPLLEQEFSPPKGHTTTILALAYLAAANGGAFEFLDFANGSPWTSPSNTSIGENDDVILDRCSRFAAEWGKWIWKDQQAKEDFDQDLRSFLRPFLRGSAPGYSSKTRFLSVDSTYIFSQLGTNYVSGTRIKAHLAVPLPDPL